MQATHRHDWRFRQARDAARCGRHLLPYRTDPVVLALHRILVGGMSGHGCDARSAQHRGLDEDLIAAVGTHRDKASLRWQLEAYLLTDLSYGEIGARTGVSARTVELFKLAFYDIDRDDPGRALGELLGRPSDAPPGQLVASRAWKTAALRGVEALEALIRSPSPEAVRDLAASAAGEARLETVQKAAEALRLLEPADSQTARTLLGIVEEVGQVPKDQPGQIEMHVKALLEHLPFGRAEAAIDRLPDELAKYKRSAVELSYEETMRVVAGEKLPNEDELLSPCFPPPGEELPPVAACKPTTGDDRQLEAEGEPPARGNETDGQAATGECSAAGLLSREAGKAAGAPGPDQQQAERSAEKPSTPDGAKSQAPDKDFRRHLKRLRKRAEDARLRREACRPPTPDELDALDRAFREDVLSIPETSRNCRKIFLAKLKFLGQYVDCFVGSDRKRFELTVRRGRLPSLLRIFKEKPFGR